MVLIAVFKYFCQLNLIYSNFFKTFVLCFSLDGLDVTHKVWSPVVMLRGGEYLRGKILRGKPQWKVIRSLGGGVHLKGNDVVLLGLQLVLTRMCCLKSASLALESLWSPISPWRALLKYTSTMMPSVMLYHSQGGPHQMVGLPDLGLSASNIVS